jgi:hypothetical protein
MMPVCGTISLPEYAAERLEASGEADLLTHAVSLGYRARLLR